MIRIAVRLDAGKSIGSGHLIRCGALAGALERLGTCSVCFICRNRLNDEAGRPVLYIGMEYEAEGDTYDFPSIIDEAAQIERILLNNKIDCLIVDHYGAGADYFRALYGKVKYLVCVDDGMGRDVAADAVINGNIYGAGADYPGVPLQLLGGSYTLLRPEFGCTAEKKIHTHVRKIYITSGGADPFGFCRVIGTALADAFEGIELHVIIGSDFSEKYAAGLAAGPFILHKNADMRQCMEDADCFVSAAGSTLYELAACGVPSISFVLADDQKLVAECLDEAGTTLVCGDFGKYDQNRFLKLCRELFFDKKLRSQMSLSGQNKICAGGADHAARQLYAGYVKKR